MDKRFPNIIEQHRDPSAFLERLEKINHKMEACYKEMDSFNERSFTGRIQTALGLDPYSRMAACRYEWNKATGQLHPFISDKDGAPAYLSSFLEENKKATNVFLCDIESEEKANVYSIEDMKGYHRSCYLSPEHICAVLTVEDGKITDACTRDEFLERFQENGIGDYSVETGRGPERELGLEINCADSQKRADDRIENNFSESQ